MAKDAVGTPQKKKLFSSNKTGKSEETLKASRLQTNGDKDEASKYSVVSLCYLFKVALKIALNIYMIVACNNNNILFLI